MNGSLQIKNDRYYMVLSYKENGKNKQKWISTKLKVKGNKRQALEMLNKTIAEFEEKNKVHGDEPGDILFVDYINQWLGFKKNKVEETTWGSYFNTVKKHLIPYFEPLKLSVKDVSSKHIVNYYEYELSNGSAISTLKLYAVILKNILSQALLEEIIDRDPSFKIPLPKKEDSGKKERFLTAEEANKLLEIFEGHWLKPIIYITLYYGLRRGEVLGLKWSAIDFKSKTVKINHTITYASKLITKDKTKTKSSKRIYTLLPEIEEMLLGIKAEQDKNRRLFGKEYKKTDYIFTKEDGSIHEPNWVTRAFSKILKRNNFPHLRFHDLRHSCASILHDKGWDIKDIQTWLGHADISTTANIYTHISATRKNEMAKDIQGILNYKIS